MVVQRVVKNLSLIMLLLLVALRPLVAERYDTATSSLTAALGVVSDASPVRTLVFDVLILVAGCGWLLGRAIGRARPYRWTGLEIGFVLLAVGAIVSCCFAGNKRLAINASVDWLCYPLLAIVLTQLLRRSWQRRLLLAVILASASAQVFICVEQYYFTYEDSWQEYQSIKADIWAEQGVPLDSDKVELFERRMQAHEVSGMLPHSNVAASYLLLCGFAALGLTIAGWRPVRSDIDHLTRVGRALLTLAIVWAIALTGSLGAACAAVVGIVVWVLLWLMRDWIRANRGRAVLAGWMAVCVVFVATVTYGIYRGSFPHMSLTFRWQYWLASSKLVADHAWTGIGAENFGRHYLQYKSISSPEEIANPHNLFVHAAANWGVAGLLGLIAMLVGGSIAIAKAVPRSRYTSKAETRGHVPAQFVDNDTSVLVVAGAVVLIALSVSRWYLLGATDPDFLYYSTMTTGLVWIAAFACFAVGNRNALAPRREFAATTAVALGVFAFLVHDLINFALFIPGTATTCFALFAFGVSTDNSDEPRQLSPGARWAPLAAGLAIVFATLWLVVRPVSTTVYHLHRAHDAMDTALAGPIRTHPTDRAYRRAAAADPLDPTACAERARWLLSLATSQAGFITDTQREEAFAEAAASLTEALQRDPVRVELYRLRARLYGAWADETGRAEHYALSVEAARAAIDRYPQDPDGLLLLANSLWQAGDAMASSAQIREAIAVYGQALALDAARPWWERIRGFREAELARIEQQIARAQHRLQDLQ